MKVNRGATSVATEQDLYWVWDETFADDGTTIYGNAGGAWTAYRSDDELSNKVSKLTTNQYSTSFSFSSRFPLIICKDGFTIFVLSSFSLISYSKYPSGFKADII